MRRPESLLSAGLALLLLVTAGVAFGKDDGARTRKNYTVSPAAFAKLDEAHKLLAAEQYGEARQALDKLSKRRGLNEHEQAVIQQTYGYIASALDNYKEAAAAFERCLALDALPPAAQHSTQYNLAQLYLADEQFGNAVATLEAWFRAAANPQASAYYLLAVAHVQSGNGAAALEPARKAVEMAGAPKEPWMQLLLSLQLERKDYDAAVVLLERLLELFPKKIYWLQLAAVYAELGREADALGVMQLAYAQGLLDKDSELRNLARMYLYQDIPYRAASVLENGLEAGFIAEDAKALELLADSYLGAREYERAVGPLGRAAELTGDGDLYVRLARVYVGREDWRKAAAALEKALAKRKLENRGRALVLLGIARFSEDEFEAARGAFTEARASGARKAQVDGWLTHLDRLAAQRAHDERAAAAPHPSGEAAD